MKKPREVVISHHLNLRGHVMIQEVGKKDVKFCGNTWDFPLGFCVKYSIISLLELSRKKRYKRITEMFLMR